MATWALVAVMRSAIKHGVEANIGMFLFLLTALIDSATLVVVVMLLCGWRPWC